MIDPTDERISVFREGDANVLPTPTGGVDGAPAVTDYEASRTKLPCIFRPTLMTFGAAGTATANQVFKIGDRPEYWAITGLTAPATNTELWIWLGTSGEGYPAAIMAGNGSAKISAAVGDGVGGALWIESRGSAGARLLVRAVRGFDYCENTYGG